MSSPGFCLVTPASRGLGFAFARHLLAHSDLPVVATARRDCDQVQDQLLQGVKNKDRERLRVFQVDVTGILLSLSTHPSESHS